MDRKRDWIEFTITARELAQNSYKDEERLHLLADIVIIFW